MRQMMQAELHVFVDCSYCDSPKGLHPTVFGVSPSLWDCIYPSPAHYKVSLCFFGSSYNGTPTSNG